MGGRHETQFRYLFFRIGLVHILLQTSHIYLVISCLLLTWLLSLWQAPSINH